MRLLGVLFSVEADFHPDPARQRQGLSRMLADPDAAAGAGGGAGGRGGGDGDGPARGLDRGGRGLGAPRGPGRGRGRPRAQAWGGAWSRPRRAGPARAAPPGSSSSPIGTTRRPSASTRGWAWAPTRIDLPAPRRRALSPGGARGRHALRGLSASCPGRWHVPDANRPPAVAAPPSPQAERRDSRRWSAAGPVRAAGTPLALWVRQAPRTGDRGERHHEADRDLRKGRHRQVHHNPEHGGRARLAGEEGHDRRLRPQGRLHPADAPRQGAEHGDGPGAGAGHGRGPGARTTSSRSATAA